MGRHDRRTRPWCTGEAGVSGAALSGVSLARRWSIIREMEERPTTPPPAPGRFADAHAVLFDLDGTVLDTIELILFSLRHATGEVLGAPLPDDVLLRNVGVPLAKQMAEFEPSRADELLTVYRAHNAVHHDRLVRAFPGVADGLAEVRSERPIGVVTSKSRVMAERGLEVTGLLESFDVVVTCDDTERHKPDPEPLLFAAGALGVDLRYCVYVGDSPHDIRAAKAAGARAVGVTWGVSSEADLAAETPDAVVDKMADLTSLFQQASARSGA